MGMLEPVARVASLDSLMMTQKEKHLGEERAFWYGPMQLLEVEQEQEQVKHGSLVKERGNGMGKLASGEEEHSVFVY